MELQVAATVTRYISEHDFTPDESWRLLEWCHAAGGDTFSVHAMGIQGEPAPACEALEAALAAWSLGEQRRPVLANPSADGITAFVPVWRLTRETIGILRSFFGDTLLHYELDEAEGWFEDPVVWRGEEIMLAVISHEREGVLRLTAGEHATAAALGFPSAESGTWI
jgi:hypothetical protein